MDASDEFVDQGLWRLYGDPESQVIAGGHSHVFCMLAALQEGNGPTGVSAAVAYTADLRNGPPGDADYWDLLIGAGKGRTVAVVWNGNQHHAGFLVSPDPPFWVFDPSAQESASEEGLWVPQELLREYWQPTFSELRELLAALVPDASVLVLGTPPPKSDAIVQQSLEKETHFLNLAKELGVKAVDLRITPEGVRLAMWNILQDMLDEIAEEAGATFVPVPAAATGPEGLLKAEYCAPDVTHANARYGALAWDAVAASLTTQVPA